MMKAATPTNDVGANSTYGNLTCKLEQEAGFARRQELLKALWRLEHPSAMTNPSSSDVPPAMEKRRTYLPARYVIEQDRGPRTQSNSSVTDTAATGEEGQSVMSNEQSLRILNQLYATAKFSLANYLRYAKPWGSPDDECLRDAIRNIADEQSEGADRVGSLIMERRGRVEGGAFPMKFTALNDLSLAYLAPSVLKDQERIVRVVESVANRIDSDSTAHALTLELLANARSHRDSLREVIGDRECDVPGNARIAHASDNGCRKSTSAVVMAA
ncbi:MAG: hypothetical protein KDB27_07710 [Planctomycetales bacterium]|nr:hypothetical protein [Planctomycetales bacterium]